MACQKPIPAQKTKKGGLYHGRRNTSQEEGFALRCRKCLDCRLNTAREKAIRAMHEASMHGNRNIFLTLTYKDPLRSTNLEELYVDFQEFMKRLLEYVNRNITIPENRIHIPFMVTGEYGDENKRPHWHVLLFNYRPDDEKSRRPNKLGHTLHTSNTIDRLWGHNDPEKAPSLYGEVTIDSAGYVARYAAKKLVHGKDQDHQFHPKHKTSIKHAIGKSWIEKYWKQTFENGYVTVYSVDEKPIRTAIPRFYTDWLKKHHPEEFLRYERRILNDLKEKAKEKKRLEDEAYKCELEQYEREHIPGTPWQPRPKKSVYSRNKILESKFKKLTKKEEKL